MKSYVVKLVFRSFDLRSLFGNRHIQWKIYDIVSGQVANDNVYETVNYYSMGIFSASEAV
jgi:hypothetical protein